MGNFNKNTSVLGVIGGSGIYNVPGLKNQHWKKVNSPFGQPSDDLLFGDLDGVEMVFLPRHGRGHKFSPSEINYRANIDILKRVGVTDIISVSAVGSLKESLKPGMFVIVDQYIDRTFAREKSFFKNGIVAHVSMAHPICTRLGDHLETAIGMAKLEHQRGGTYLVMEGPQFSTKAESELYRSWNCDVIGMTNMPEAKLAREAEICYASVAMVTDYDCWHDGHNHVTMDQIVKVLLENAENARTVIKLVAPIVARDHHSQECSCRSALSNAIVTSKDMQNQDTLKKLDAITARIFSSEK